MPFSRPTLSRLISRVQADVESLLQNGASRVRRSVEWVMARVMAGLSHGLHGHLDYLAKQIVPSSDMDDDFLIRWATLWGVERNAAVKAEFTITVTGVAAAALPINTQYQRADGTLYKTLAANVVEGSGEVSVTVQALEAGSAGNTDAGSVLSLVSPVVDIDADATVEGSPGELQGGGADQESLASLLERLQARIQSPPSGGGPGDYVDWAKEVDGVTRAWELPNQMGPGTVVVLIVQDNFDDDGNYESTTFPVGALVTATQAYIDGLAPVTADITVQAPVSQPLNPTIQLSPNTADVQAAVTTYLNDLLLRRAGPGETLLLSEINEAISLATGEEDHVVVSPVADVVAGVTSLITLGTPTYQAIP